MDRANDKPTDPTDKELGVFWGQFGFKYVFGERVRSGEFTEQNYYWVAPAGRRFFKLPELNMGNLLGYAVATFPNKSRVCFARGYPNIDTVTCTFWTGYPDGQIQQTEAVVSQTKHTYERACVLALYYAINRVRHE